MIYEDIYDDKNISLSDDDAAAVFSVIETLKPKTSAHSFRRVGPKRDGAYILSSDVVCKWALSIGVGTFPDNADVHLAQSGVEVFEFDHTVDKTPYPHPNINFYKKGLGYSDEDFLISISEMIKISGDRKDSGVLMMDCEGAEWDMLSSDDAVDSLNYFSQLSMELHGILRMATENPKKLIDSMESLSRNHVCVSNHVNSYGVRDGYGVGVLDNFIIPNIIEATFIHKKKFKPGKKLVSKDLYVPNDPDYRGKKPAIAFSRVGPQTLKNI